MIKVTLHENMLDIWIRLFLVVSVNDLRWCCCPDNHWERVSSTRLDNLWGERERARERDIFSLVPSLRARSSGVVEWSGGSSFQERPGLDLISPRGQLHYFWIYNRDALLFTLEMLLGRRSCWRQLQASFFRLLCLLPTGFPVRSVDMQRTTDNITIRQGDTAIIR